MSRSRKTIGLITGMGELPLAVAREARRQGYGLAAANLEGLADGNLGELARASAWFNIGKVGGIMKFFKSEGATEALMAGKVPRSVLYRGGIRPDLKGARILFRLRDRSDDAVIRVISEEFEKEGIRFLDIRDFCRELLTPEGKLTRKAPGRALKGDMEFGFRMARECGRLGIGQTVVVKERAVIAVEAAEGTDEAIRRGGELSGGGATVAKASRPGQDMRFDVPVVGLDTMAAMEEARAAALVLEAGASILLDRDEFIRRAEAAGIAVVGASA
ncbi:MAG: UDP-2,3-diacylglucosamine diphosphatase LpxI [Thermodesulfovibrionales bacterium]